MPKVVLSTFNAKFIHLSLSLRYLRESVRENHHVKILEYTIHDPLDQVVAEIFEEAPDLIGLSCYIWNIEKIEKILPTLRKVLPKAFIILGGPEVSYDAREYMIKFPDVNAIAVGEGEELFRELVYALDYGHEIQNIKGMYVREQGQILFSGTRANAQLSSINSPYPEEFMHELKHKIIYYETSRGCPFTCQFCLSSTEVGVRFFPLDRVLDDLRRLLSHKVQQINFVDRTFNLRKDYALQLFAFLAKAEGDTTFHFEITGDILHQDLVDWLLQHAPEGRFRFEIGVQSTNETTNRIVQRRQDFQKLAYTVLRIQQAGKIHQHLDLIAGLPGEDYSSFRQTFNDVYALRPDEIQLGFLKLLRGTNLRKDANKYGYLAMDTPPYEVLTSNELTYQEMIRLKRLEDILEKYYNSGRFKHVLTYITEYLFTTPFDFFQLYGDYWHAKGWSRIGHQPLDLVLHLQDFLIFAGVMDDTIAALLRADYLLREKQRPRTLYWKNQQDEKSQMRWFVEHSDLVISSFSGLSEELQRTDVTKRVVIERIPEFAMKILMPTFSMIQPYADDSISGTVFFLYPVVPGKPVMFGFGP